MINADMREYPYYLYGEPDEYGQTNIIKDENGEPVVQGTVQMAIYTTSQSIQDNINYQNATYLGLSLSNIFTDKFIIGTKGLSSDYLKVLYTNPQGRYTQVFLGSI